VHNEPSLTLHDVDALLDELATNSPFSNLEAHRITPLAPDFQPREPRTIIKLLFRDLTPYQSAVMAQIILKDLSPLLYPLPTRSTHLSLVQYNSTAFYRVEPAEVMQQWHWALRHLALVRDLDVAALLIEEVGLRACVPSNRPSSHFAQLERRQR
jgi:DNA ligase-4